MPRFLLSLPLVFALPPVLVAADWPQWRGPARDGHAPGARLPAKWPERAPQPAWKVKVGEGYAGAAVAGGKVFALARDDAKGTETASCFDLANGKRLWEFSYDAPFKAPDPTAGRGPNATPTADGDRVYFFGLAGMLTCAKVATGEVLWKHDCLKEYWGVAARGRRRPVVPTVRRQRLAARGRQHGDRSGRREEGRGRDRLRPRDGQTAVAAT